MSIESQMIAVFLVDAGISALAGNRIYPLVLPEQGQYPAVTLQRIMGHQTSSLKGMSKLENARIQVDAWALSYKGVKTLADAIKTAMDSAIDFKSVLLTDQDFFEPDEKLYRVSIDFSVWMKQ